MSHSDKAYWFSASCGHQFMVLHRQQRGSSSCCCCQLATAAHLSCSSRCGCLGSSAVPALSYFNVEDVSAGLCPHRPLPVQVEGKAAAPGWPSAGALSYRGVWMQYRPELDPVLKVSQCDMPSDRAAPA